MSKRYSDAKGFVSDVIDERPCTTAELAIYGDSLVPDEVDRLLDIKAGEAYGKGETIPSMCDSRTAPTGMWFLKVHKAGRVEPHRLVVRLLERLPKDTAPWHELAMRFDVQVRVRVTPREYGSEFDLPSELMAALARMRCRLVVLSKMAPFDPDAGGLVR